MRDLTDTPASGDPWWPNIRPYDRDDDLLDATRRDGRRRVRVYAAEGTAVVLGRGSRPDVELHLDACLADGVPLLRRRGGGCAVLLDPGNVIVCAAMPAPGLGGHRAYFETISSTLIAALDDLGLHGVRREGISDLAVGDRKVGGACIYRAEGILFYAATLLVSPRLDLVARYLRHPPREPAYRKGRSHAAFLGRLDRLQPGLDAPTAAAGLSERLAGRPFAT